MKFRLSGIPMPPSSNHQYAARVFTKRNETGRNFTMAKICPTRELDLYQKAFENWSITKKIQVVKAGVLCRNWMLDGFMISIYVGLCWPREKLWTLDNQPKRNDATDRIKALHDCLAKAIGVDDRCFWVSTEEKLQTNKRLPWCFIDLFPVRPCSVMERSK